MATFSDASPVKPGSASKPDSALPRQSLTSAVVDKLREQIIRGEIPEGTQLRQEDIANYFAVSRIPVREALRQLHAEGLITIVQHRGAVIPELSSEDVEELFSIRALLEPEVLKASISNLGPQEFVEAEAILHKYEDDLQHQDRVSSWGRLNWQFHSLLYSKANLPHFLSVIRNINDRAERYTRLQLFLTQGFARANEEHERILALCRKRDLPGACNLLRQHIFHAGQSLKEALRERRAAKP